MRRTFLADNGHDCGEELEVVVERRPAGCDYRPEEHYRLVAHPNQCKCRFVLHRFEPTQDELMAAYALPEAEDV